MRQLLNDTRASNSQFTNIVHPSISAFLGVSMAADCYCAIKAPNTPDGTRNSDSQSCCSGTGDWSESTSTSRWIYTPEFAHLFVFLRY